MSCKLKIKKSKNLEQFEKIVNTNPQTIEVGTVVNYSIKGGFNAFALSNVLDSGSSKGIPGWNYNEKALEKNREKYKKLFIKGVNRMIKKNYSISALMNEIGINASSDYKNMIESIKTPKNSPATIKKKGFNNPMVDTGKFKSNIAARINKNRIVGRGLG